MFRTTILLPVCVGLLVLLAFAGLAVRAWPTVFDDAFISYRYGRNLAEGHGITWNAGEPPTEGYTNFLLVVLLAPCIRLGLDPLTVTRLLSYLSLLAISLSLYFIARRRYASSAPAAFLAGALVWLAPATRSLCLTGLETLIYAAFLLWSVVAGQRFLESPSVRASVSFSLVLFTSSLLRPEAILLYAVVMTLHLAYLLGRRARDLRPAAWGVGALLALVLPYLCWKQLHFGQLLPNPFFLKAARGGLISPLGLGSVLAFVETYALFIALTLGSLLLESIDKVDGGDGLARRSRHLLGLSFVAVSIAFFAHTDTLMDIHGRFLYPLVPILVYLALPTLIRGFELGLKGAERNLALLFALALAYILAFNAGFLLKAPAHAKQVLAGVPAESGNSLMQREYRLARSLARLPGIEEVRIAFGDSGVIPYYTRSPWLDLVGLNDGFIARHRDLEELVDYFFNWNADLVIHPGGKDHTWLRYGHGPLGDYASWARDERWDGYTYVGTCRTAGRLYDLHFLVRRSSPHFDRLQRFLRERVIDGSYWTLPLAIGSHAPERGTIPRWLPAGPIFGATEHRLAAPNGQADSP